MSWSLRALLVAGVGLTLVLSACAGGSPPQATVTIHYSHFEPNVVTVPAGVPVIITLRNDDPIDHEWIVGTPDVHARHRVGTEPYHNERPSEVTVPALSARVTVLTFDEPGDYAFICHLPGHEDYGMVGILRVAAS